MSTPAFALPGFTADQHKVLDALAKGASISAAARSTGLHRTTLYYWQRTQPAFNEAVKNARRSYRAGVQYDFEALADKAVTTVTAILDNPKASDSVRLRAALAVIHRVHEPQLDVPCDAPAPPAEPTDAEVGADLAQMEQALGLAPVEADPAPDVVEAELARIEAEIQSLPDYLQPVETIRRAGPKVGRNDDCPCGSTRKYKRCCGR